MSMQPQTAALPIVDLLVLIYASELNQAQEDLAVDLGMHLQGEVHLLGLAATASEKATIIPKLDELRARLTAAGVRASTSVDAASPVEAVRNRDNPSRPRLLVVGALGRTGLTRRLFGPVALDLLDALNESLIFVPSSAPVQIQRILLPIGALSYSHRAVETAALLAQKYAAQVTLMHTVISNEFAPEALKEPTDMREFLASDTLFAHNFREAMALLTDWGITVIPRLRRGSPLHQILAETRSTPYDLAVIGSHYSAGSVSKLLGGISQSIVRQAGIPVLVARGDIRSE